MQERILQRDGAQWLRLPASSGETDAYAISQGKAEVHVPLLLSASGLRERAVPYKETLLIEVRSQFEAATRSELLDVALSVQAQTSTVAWGKLPPSEGCAQQGAHQLSTIVGEQRRTAFTACDIDQIPVDHSLPTQSDPRRFAAKLSTSAGAENI
eukprot:5785014-Prymnesium_polylepis.1